MRTVVASSPPPLLSEPKAIETGVKAPLAAMNQLSLGFASTLQALAQQPTQASAAGKLAQLWARAMDAMVTAVEVGEGGGLREETYIDISICTETFRSILILIYASVHSAQCVVLHSAWGLMGACALVAFSTLHGFRPSG